jgi:hypothetical protein
MNARAMSRPEKDQVFRLLLKVERFDREEGTQYAKYLAKHSDLAAMLAGVSIPSSIRTRPLPSKASASPFASVSETEGVSHV